MALSNDWPLATLGHHLQGVVPMAIEGTKERRRWSVGQKGKNEIKRRAVSDCE